MNTPMLYQAVYQARAGRCRRMTFAANSQAEAEQVAQDWQVDAARPLIVKALRPLHSPQFELIGGRT